MKVLGNPMIDVVKSYSDFCQSKGIPFVLDSKITSYDDTTLFCPAGMQQFKKQFKDTSIANMTQANIQACLRLLDLDTIGDGTHFLYFNMIGLFSFRGMSVQKAVDFWMEFLSTLQLKPDYVTIHPDKPEWLQLYNNYGVEVKADKECVWSDGELSGYCTEFYKDGVEIGNIVNICGDCIDVGFGLERLEMVVNKTPPKSDVEVLEATIQKILDSGVTPSNKQHGYVLRRLMRLLHKKGGYIDSVHFKIERERQENIIQKYLKIKDRYPGKTKEWWFDTHGIDIDLVE
jgi:alanyl-tRNA synthetase